jgi:hypothetical protein
MLGSPFFWANPGLEGTDSPDSSLHSFVSGHDFSRGATRHLRLRL